jgi:hypothetical protein
MTFDGSGGDSLKLSNLAIESGCPKHIEDVIVAETLTFVVAIPMAKRHNSGEATCTAV